MKNQNQTASLIRESWPSKVDEYGNWSRPIPSLDQWLSSSDTSWIEPLYAKCFSGVFQSKRSIKREATFQIIVVNLAKARTEICCPVDSRTWTAVNPLPVNFGVALIGKCVEALEKHEYLTSRRMFHDSKAKHPVTYIRPTEKLLACSPMSLRYRIDDDGVIRCKDFERPRDYLANPFVSQRYHTVVQYNRMMADTPEQQIYSVFTPDFHSMGRFFGSRMMMTKKEDRKHLTVDGERLFKADIKSCLAWIALAKTHRVKLGTDFYDIEEFPRELVKAATVRALHCSSRRDAERSLRWWTLTDKDGKEFQGYKVPAVFDALDRKMSSFQGILYANRGLELMADESFRMSLFLEDMVTDGVKVYPIHDAVIGKLSDKEIILEHFIEAFTINGIEPTVDVETLQ